MFHGVTCIQYVHKLCVGSTRPRSTALEASTPTITPPMRFTQQWKRRHKTINKTILILFMFLIIKLIVFFELWGYCLKMLVC
jgi:hypothetical protein